MNAWPLVLVPAVAAVVGFFVGRDDRFARAVAVGGGGLTLLLAVVAWAVQGEFPVISAGPGLHAGEVQVPLELVTDHSRVAVVFAVALVALAVQVYSTWYLETDDRYPRFAATVSLFTAAMVLVVVSADLVLTVVGWEVMGWCSYLLIGHWSRRPSARRAAHKAFLVTRVADIGFVLGIIGLAAGANSTNLQLVVATWARPTACIDSFTATGTSVGEALTACSAPDGTLRAVFLTLVVIGVLGKSAQIPFQDWLADAMEGPTPASALIHAATMVAAGTVVLAGFFPILAVSQTPRWVLGIAVSLTMLLAAVLAFAQSDLKRLLAWSTVSQVGVMLSALAAAPPEAGPDAGLFHLWSHAIFKALLFLAIGWAAMAAGGTAAKALRGTALATPLLRVSFLFGLLSLAGVPLVVGGLSKEHVVAVSWEGAVESGPGVVVLVALIVTAAVTAAYCTRAYLLLTAHVRPAPESAPITPAVQGVLAVLVGLSVVGGLVLLTDAFRVGQTDLVWVFVTVLAIVVGVAVALRGGFDRDPAEVLVPRLVPHADRGLGVDALYLRLVATPVLRLARLVAFLDTEVIDAYVRGTAVVTRAAGWAGTRAFRGERPSSAVGLVLGAVVVLGVAGVLAWS
ncbi:MAG TPA: NADH-quinone oxidoreductase subunit L [Ornithinibacter sp.]|nr:NADH-quinone oxidoreductase subunit L [Ornithinibacter sp.]